MANWTPSPATAPAEAPEISSIKALQDKKADALSFLEESTDLNPTDKENFKKEFEASIAQLMSNKATEKDKNIGAFIAAELQKLKVDIKNEKNDTNDTLDDINTDAVWNSDTEKKLSVENEIKWQLNEFRTSIENRLNASEETPPTTPEAPTEPVTPEVFLTEPAIPEDLIPPNRDYVSKTQPNWLANIILQFFGDTPWIKRWVLGFKNDNEMKYTESSMNNIIAVKWSPVNDIVNFNDLSIRDFRDILGQFGTLDFWVLENVEAAFQGKHADNPKYIKYHRIYNGIGDVAQKIKDNWEAYDPVQRMMALLENNNKTEYNPDYTTTEQNNAEPNINPTPEAPIILTDAEQEAEDLKSAQELDEAQNQAQKELDQAEAIPDNPEAINIATEKLKSAKEAVAESIDASKKSLEDTLKKQEKELSDTTLAITTAERELDKAKKASDIDPTNTELQTKKAEADKNLATLKLKEKNLKEALTDIRENLMKKFETPWVTTALEATQIMADVENKLAIAHGATEVVETKTENQTAEEKEKADKEAEKVKKEKEKLFGIYNKIKESNESYSIDEAGGMVYLIDEEWTIFRYPYNKSVDGKWTDWLWSFQDHNLPLGWDSETIEQYDGKGDWLKTDKKTDTIGWENSEWDSNKKRDRMKNDAPPIPDWYNS